MMANPQAGSTPRRKPYQARSRQCVSPVKRVQALRAELRVAKQQFALFLACLHLIGSEVAAMAARNATAVPEIKRIIMSQARSRRNLDGGRPHGPAKLKSEKAERIALWKELAVGIYKAHPTWTASDAVDEIVDRQRKNIIRGRAYSHRTILDAIRGVKRSALLTSGPNVRRSDVSWA